MYRFNTRQAGISCSCGIPFKYNPCIGSIFSALFFNGIDVIYLNTTHVSVQCCEDNKKGVCVEFKYNPCIGSIKEGRFKEINTRKFKYNPCIGSI